MVRTLAAVGEGLELAKLEQIARRRPENEAQERIRDAIVEVLPGWKARLEGRQDAQSLPRGATATASEEEYSLLRAANSAVSTEPEELLRAGTSQGSS